MKTIKEASIERANKFAEVIVEETEIPCMIEDLNLWAKEDFKAGVEFAQYWHPITELPPKEIDKFLNSEVSNEILIKEVQDFGCVRVGWYDYSLNKWFIIGHHEVFPDFWREIDIK